MSQYPVICQRWPIRLFEGCYKLLGFYPLMCFHPLQLFFMDTHLVPPLACGGILGSFPRGLLTWPQQSPWLPCFLAQHSAPGSWCTCTADLTPALPCRTDSSLGTSGGHCPGLLRVAGPFQCSGAGHTLFQVKHTMSSRWPSQPLENGERHGLTQLLSFYTCTSPFRLEILVPKDINIIPYLL